MTQQSFEEIPMIYRAEYSFYLRVKIQRRGIFHEDHANPHQYYSIMQPRRGGTFDNPCRYTIEHPSMIFSRAYEAPMSWHHRCAVAQLGLGFCLEVWFSFRTTEIFELTELPISCLG